MAGLRVTCPYCDRPAKLVTGADIYKRRPDLVAKAFWLCVPCQAWVGCHPKANAAGKGGVGDGTVPLGRLANEELRQAKQRAHSALDPLWRSGLMRRPDAYAMLARELGISTANCHIGMFDVDTCRAVVAAVARIRKAHMAEAQA